LRRLQALLATHATRIGHLKLWIAGCETLRHHIEQLELQLEFLQLGAFSDPSIEIA